MTNLIISARTSILDIEYIFNHLKNNGPSKYDKWFSRQWTALWYHAIIETNKLFESSNKGKFCFEKLQNLIVNNYRKLDWVISPSTEEINMQFDQLLKDKKTLSAITAIKTLRNEHFAHSDLNPTEIETYSSDVKDLLDKSGSLLNFICNNLLGYCQVYDLSESNLQHSVFEKLFD